MQWIEVSVPTRSDEIDDVCAQLAELGAGGMVVEDETDFQQFLEQNHQYWDYVDDALEAQFRGVSRIKFYLADDDDGHAQLAAIRAGIGRELTTTTVRDSDWENNWRQYYQPIETGERLVVVPEWLDAPADGRLPLRLDPGLIFGTGSHAIHGDGRKGWWVYIEGQPRGEKNSRVYDSQQEAEEAVQYLRSQGLPAVATNGEDAHLTLQKAFAAKQNTIIRMAETILGEEMK